VSTARRRFTSNTSLAVYATIVATAVIAGADDLEPGWSSWQLLITLVGTLVVLLFAEVYSDVLGDPSADPLRMRLRRATAYRWPVMEPAVPMGLPLLLGGLGVISDAAAVWATLIVAVGFLGVGGAATTRLRGRPWHRVILSGLVSALVGVIIIILKAWH
jgi:hypothetical protein